MDRTVGIDLGGCRYPVELWQRVEDALGLPGWFGKNLDALYDVLRDYGQVGAVTTLVFLGSDGMGREAGLLFDLILPVLEKSERENPLLRIDVRR